MPDRLLVFPGPGTPACRKEMVGPSRSNHNSFGISGLGHWSDRRSDGTAEPGETLGCAGRAVEAGSGIRSDIDAIAGQHVSLRTSCLVGQVYSAWQR